VRNQPGGAGTIINNLIALGVAEVFPVAFCGLDGEGMELQRALKKCANVNSGFFVQTSARVTFTYTKPMLHRSGALPEELNRLDFKNWTPTPTEVQELLCQSVTKVAAESDALVLLDQVDQPNTGVITPMLLEAVTTARKNFPRLKVIADSRRGLRDFPRCIFKMNRAELRQLLGGDELTSLDAIKEAARTLAQRNKEPVFVTLAEEGLVGALPSGEVDHHPAFPLRGPIDVVGAGDSVTANLITSLVAGATLREALEIAAAASSVVIHKVGTTGTANFDEIAGLICSR
jgi:rfaE bifunctional protein kinase chain/domain